MKPERDPRVCATCNADTELVATPVGPLCHECANDLADENGGETA